METTVHSQRRREAKDWNKEQNLYSKQLRSCKVIKVQRVDIKIGPIEIQSPSLFVTNNDNRLYSMTENEISKILVDIAYRIHINLGPGLLESVYETIFVHELIKHNLEFKQQIKLPVNYDNAVFENALRIDLLIDDKVIVELKSVEQVLPVHKKQLLT